MRLCGHLVGAMLALVAIPSAAFAYHYSSDYEGYGRQRGSVRFDVHADLGWGAAPGAGFRADLAIVPDGLVARANDDLALSLGAEGFFGSKLGIWPIGALQWNFYLPEHWSLFPELGVVAFTGEKQYRKYADPFVYAAPFVSFGARYHMSPRLALLMRVNWPAGFQLGLTF